jgi:hypothetical protein
MPSRIQRKDPRDVVGVYERWSRRVCAPSAKRWSVGVFRLVEKVSVH